MKRKKTLNMISPSYFVCSETSFSNVQQSPVSLEKAITDLEWKNLIILDACRYDVFAYISTKLKVFSNVKPALSPASSTPEFIRNIIIAHRDLFKNVIYISANPMIDSVLKRHGFVPQDVFYKYIPAWKIAWNEEFNTVLPKDMLLLSLKAFLKYPSRRIVVHFLQPHFPYISDKYIELNKLVYTDIRNALLVSQRYVLNKKVNSKHRCKLVSEDNIRIIVSLLKMFFSCGVISSILSIDFCKYAKNYPYKIVEAYIVNLIRTLPYVKILTNLMPGLTLITSDHGEALGDFVHKLIPVRFWGHISRLGIPSLICVPFVEVSSSRSLEYSVREILKWYVRYKIKPSSCL